MRTLLVLSLLLLPTVALAQSETPPPVIVQKTVLDFEGDLVEAGLDRPDFGLIESQKRHRHASLIRVRDSFAERVVASANKL